MLRFDLVQFELAAATLPQLPPSSDAEIVFSGRSNVGKSSLINKLCNRKALARVSNTPGKTATINFYKLTGAHLVDLPGYGYAKVSQGEKRRWANLIEGYFESGRRIALVIQLIDMRHPPTADDLGMLEYLAHSDFRFIVALTKSDKLKPMQRKKRMEEIQQELSMIEGVAYVPFSSLNGEGVEEIRDWIGKAVEEENSLWESQDVQ